MSTRRRHFLATAAASVAAPTAAVATGSALAQGGSPGAPTNADRPTRPALLRARRLMRGDTLALFSPSGAIHERAPFEFARESLQALGFQVREAPHLRARYGHLAGTDAQRAGDINALFADSGVHGLLAMTGGSGANRLLPLLDYPLIGRNPKFLGGFSDITALLSAVNTQTGLVGFHGPMGGTEWNSFNIEHWRGAVVEGLALTLSNPPARDDNIISRVDRTSTLHGGRARGHLVGGNLSVFASLAGSAYWPHFDGAILFLEEVNEYIYRIDRMLSTLKLAGVLDRVAGVVLGAFTRCEPGDGRYGVLTLDEVFDDHLKPLKVPVYRGALFGHIKRNATLPVGLPVEMDADAGTLRFLQAAVV
jgi:muramoyltetrapeptide carboxypeptidase